MKLHDPMVHTHFAQSAFVHCVATMLTSLALIQEVKSQSFLLAILEEIIIDERSLSLCESDRRHNAGGWFPSRLLYGLEV